MLPGTKAMTGAFITQSAGPPASATYYTNSVINALQTSYTFSSLAIGTAASTRFVVVGIVAYLNNTSAVSSVTIGGITAAPLNDPGSVTSSGGSAVVASIWGAIVPTGTTATVVVNFSTAPFRCGVGVWTLSASSNTPTSTQRATGASNPLSVSILVSSGGVVIGVSAMLNLSAAGSYTWAGATKDYDALVGGAVTQSGAHQAYTTVQPSLTVSTTYSQTPSAGVSSMLAVCAFR